MIHTYQRTIRSTEGETEGVVVVGVVDNDSVTQWLIFHIAAVGKVSLRPDFILALLTSPIIYIQLSSIDNSKGFAHPMHVILMIDNKVEVVQLSCDVGHQNVAALFSMAGSDDHWEQW